MILNQKLPWKEPTENLSNRFKYLETKALEMGRSLKEMSLEEMEAIWQEAKSI